MNSIHARIFTVVVAFLLTFGLFVSLTMSSHSSGDLGKSDSVELGLLELSPRGEAGGYAMPASGSSNVGSCTVWAPASVRVGDGAQVTACWRASSGGSCYLEQGPFDYRLLLVDQSSGIDVWGGNRLNLRHAITRRMPIPYGPLVGGNTYDVIMTISKHSDTHGGRLYKTCTDQIVVVDVPRPNYTPSHGTSVGAGTTFAIGSPVTFDGTVTNSGAAAFDSTQGNNGNWAAIEIDLNRDGYVNSTQDRRHAVALEGITPGATESISYVPTNLPVGNHRYRVVADANNEHQEVDETDNTTGWINFETYPPALNPVTVSGTPSPTFVNTSVSWTSNVSGGVPPYTYSWSGTGALTGSAAQTNKTYTVGGTKQGNVTVTDSVGQTLTGNGSVVVHEYPSGSISTSPSTVIVGDGTNLTWNTNHTNNCVITSSPNIGSFSGVAGTNQATAPLPSTTIFTLSCEPLTGGALIVVDTATTDTYDLPTLDNPSGTNIVRAGTPFTLDWDTTDSDPSTCSISGQGVSGYNPLASQSGSLTVTTQNDSFYTITCVYGTATYGIEVVPSSQEI